MLRLKLILVNGIPSYIMDMLTYPYWHECLSLLVKGPQFGAVPLNEAMLTNCQSSFNFYPNNNLSVARKMHLKIAFVTRGNFTQTSMHQHIQILSEGQ